MAGALGVQLAGDATYFGVVHKKPYIGDKNRENGGALSLQRFLV